MYPRIRIHIRASIFHGYIRTLSGCISTSVDRNIHPYLFPCRWTDVSVYLRIWTIIRIDLFVNYTDASEHPWVRIPIRKFFFCFENFVNGYIFRTADADTYPLKVVLWPKIFDNGYIYCSAGADTYPHIFLLVDSKLRQRIYPYSRGIEYICHLSYRCRIRFNDKKIYFCSCLI